MGGDAWFWGYEFESHTGYWIRYFSPLENVFFKEDDRINDDFEIDK